MTITSPPYFDIKNYGSRDQIGYGQTYENYLKDLEHVFEKVYDLTTSDGSLWVIIDTFKRKDELVPLPFDFAATIKRTGWKLRDVVIWRKDRTVPWSKHGDTRGIFEYVLVFSRGNAKFKYRIDNVREIEHLKGWWVRYPERYNPRGKSPDEIWTFDIPTQGSWGNGTVRHFCPLPSGLINRILKLTTDPGDVVLDPFAGSGSVLIEAHLMGRRSLGIELNRSDVRSFPKRLREEVTLRKSAERARAPAFIEPKRFEQLIVSLRILKFARILQKRIPKAMAAQMRAIFVERAAGDTELPHKIVRATYTFYAPKLDKARSKLLAAALTVSSKPPLSKFGVEPQFDVIRGKTAVLDNFAGKKLYYYTALNTNNLRGKASPSLLDSGFHIVSSIQVRLAEADYI